MTTTSLTARGLFTLLKRSTIEVTFLRKTETTKPPLRKTVFVVDSIGLSLRKCREQESTS